MDQRRPSLKRSQSSKGTFGDGRNSSSIQRRHGPIGRFNRATTIDPRTNHYIAYWDLVTTLALLFTALVTPVEVAFLVPPKPADRLTNGLYMTNRGIDVIFITDMLLQLKIAYQARDEEGVRWVLNPYMIAKHYLTSWWFALDLFSILTSVFDLVEDNSMKSGKTLRAVRTLRLIKLVKLARGSRILKRWEMRMSINYSYLTLGAVTTMIVVACHWVACIWGLQASFAPLNSWQADKGYCVPWYDDLGRDNLTLVEVTQWIEDGTCNQLLADAGILDAEHWTCEVGTCGEPGSDNPYCEIGNIRSGYACAHWLDQYSYSLYFSVMTVTSVGYGDISAHRFNVVEQIVCVFIMLLTGMIWGYLIGIFCAMAAPGPTKAQFRSELSELNNFMSEHNFAPEMRFRLREYMHQTVSLRKLDARRHLLTKLSPAMQGEMSLLINEATVGKVWYLHGTEVGLMIHIASKLKPAIFPPTEFCPGGFLYIIERGYVIYCGRPRRQAHLGEDVLLNNPDLEMGFPAVSVSYSSVLALDGKALNAAIQMFPISAAKLDWVKRRWGVRRCVVREAERRCFNATPRIHFRGRLYPLYDKKTAKKMRQERVEYDARMEAAAPVSSTPLSLRFETRTKSGPFGRRPSGSSPGSKGVPGLALKGRKMSSADKLAAKHARAAKMSASAEYGMQMRVQLMKLDREGPLPPMCKTSRTLQSESHDHLRRASEDIQEAADHFTRNVQSRLGAMDDEELGDRIATE